VFVSGAAVLIVEIAGARVVAPLYGSGLYSWSALITVTLAALSLGYWAGGRLADRRPDATLFHGGILSAGLLVSAVPLVAGGVLQWSEPLDSRLGVLVAAFLLFFPSLTVLGGVTPFAIRLARPSAVEVGRVSGVVFAVSTFGSLLAAFATGFVLIPNFGVRSILAATGAALLAMAAVGHLLGGRRAAAAAGTAVALALLVAAQPGGRTDPRLRIVARTPSFYGYLRVVDVGSERMLTVNGIGQNYVSLEPGAEPFPYLQFMAAVPELVSPRRAEPRGLLIGLGAGELVGLLEARGVRMAVVEIDPRIEELARRWFGLRLDRERVHIQDGRAFLARDRDTYDFVFMDAFHGEDVPGHLFTREAFEAVRRRLEPGGVLAINFTTIPEGRDAPAVIRTLREVFPEVRAYTDGTQASDLASMILLARDRPLVLDAGALRDRPGAAVFLDHEIGPDLRAATVLTDDHNPISRYRLGVGRVWRQRMIQHVGLDWAYWADF